MITTSFLFLLITFEICYLTSKQFKPANSPTYVQPIISNPKPFRIGAGILFAITVALLITYLGWASGIAAVLIGLMAAGSLVVILQPFRYISLVGLILLYIAMLLLEIFI